MGSNRKLGKVFIAAILCLAIVAPGTARSDGIADAMLITSISITAFEVIMITFAAGNLYYAVKGEKPSGAWETGGYICGVLSILAGFWALPSASDDDLSLGFAIGGFALGAATIGFTIWASSQPERPKQKLTVGPIIMSDVRGKPAVGVGLQLVSW
jgi:hypothetical protein